MALWDIKGKALGVPVYELLGGQSREHIECYSTGFPEKGSLKETARACVEAGFRAFRTAVAEPGGRRRPSIPTRWCARPTTNASEIREGVGKDGDWAIDYHTRLDLPDAIRLSTLIEPLEPYFCEDLLRSENTDVYRELRAHVKVPIAVGEQFGDRWDVNRLIEQRLIDYARVTIPNVGGITEYKKIATLCETHYVGLIPHFTGPVAEAAVAHVASHVLRSGSDGDAGRGSGPGAALARLLRFSQRQDLAQSPARFGRGVRSQAAADRPRSHGAQSAHSAIPSAGWFNDELVGPTKAVSLIARHRRLLTILR